MSARIMVVDNAESIRELFDAILTDQGWLAFAYTYAQVSLSTVEQVNPDLIILDFAIQGGGEGWNLLQLLKMADQTAAIPVLVSTTAVHFPPEIASYLATRHIGVVYKPFDSTPFLLKVEQMLTSASHMPGITQVALPILMIDDNESIRESISTVLRLEGYLVVTASNGRLALEAVRHGRHGLIILDDQMPIMTGREFLAAYAQDLPPHSPVIIASANADEIIEELPPFVMGKLTKPFQMAELLTLVKQYMEPA